MHGLPYVGPWLVGQGMSLQRRAIRHLHGAHMQTGSLSTPPHGQEPGTRLPKRIAGQFCYKPRRQLPGSCVDGQQQQDSNARAPEGHDLVPLEAGLVHTEANPGPAEAPLVSARARCGRRDGTGYQQDRSAEQKAPKEQQTAADEHEHEEARSYRKAMRMASNNQVPMRGPPKDMTWCLWRSMEVGLVPTEASPGPAEAPLVSARAQCRWHDSMEYQHDQSTEWKAAKEQPTAADKHEHKEPRPP
jgi:hypothetical protein